MSADRLKIIKLADAVSEVLYTAAGGLLIGLGVVGIVMTVLRTINESVPSDPGLSAVVILFSVSFLILGLFVTPQLRRRINRRESVTQFGQMRTVDARVVDSDEGMTDDCIVCGSQSDQGLIRRYRKEFYIAGVPIFTVSENHNFYCIECATAETTSPVETTETITEAERH